MRYEHRADRALLKDRETRKPRFKLVHQSNDACQMLTNATTREDAAFAGLTNLGWTVVKYYPELGD